MSTNIDISRESRERLDRFLARCERKLAHLSTSERKYILNLLEEYLLKSGEEGLGKRLLHHKDVTALINPFLIEKGLPLIKVKGKNLIFYIILFFFLLIGLTIYGVVKSVGSFFSSFNIDEKQVSFGDFKISINESFDGGHKLKGLDLSQQGMIEQKEFERIVIDASESVLNIESNGESFIFDCKTNDTNYSPISISNKELLFKLEGSNKCSLTLPSEIPFKVSLVNGVISLKNMAQGFKVSAAKSTLYWTEARPELFSLTKNISGVSIINAKFSDNGQYHVDIKVDDSIVKIKKFQIR